MKKILLLLFIGLFALWSFDAMARTRTHVVVPKRLPPYATTQPIIVIPVALIPPLAVFYDFQRRTNCIGDVLGMGGPGFTEPMPVGNVMVPAYQRGLCQAAPK